MTLLEALQSSNELEATCVVCGVRTRLSIPFFTARRGLEASVQSVGRSLVCAGCGAPHVIIGLAGRAD
ncbi:MAG: hypothetical protein H7124_05400 [Phycisphaerales bacterium]|nr:hypothetical protein [Hyphomonadaceae bacterium]